MTEADEYRDKLRRVAWFARYRPERCACPVYLSNREYVILLEAELERVAK